ncbi:MAG: hypothetical protein EA374_05500 [Acholeplasmatales bacterium]|nr:MAG: hypothetical protein EA374_05500 [Acholeplasmatales bacterium]
MREFLHFAVLLVGFYLLGAVPFSVWIGRLFLREDIRLRGDGNPGAANVFKTGKIGFGILAMGLDFAKGFVPLFIYGSGNTVPVLWWILMAWAPVLGHATSPFLKFKGGKAIAVTFGVWSALTTWVGPTWLGSMLVFFSFVVIFNTDGWKVQAALLTLVIPLWLMGMAWPAFVVLLGHMVISAFKHRADLCVKPEIRLAWWRVG